MKNITLSADEHLIELAREKARQRKTTLNAMFRDWLKEFSQQEENRKRADEVIRNLSQHLSFIEKPTREEMNER